MPMPGFPVAEAALGLGGAAHKQKQQIDETNSTIAGFCSGTLSDFFAEGRRVTGKTRKIQQHPKNQILPTTICSTDREIQLLPATRFTLPV